MACLRADQFAENLLENTGVDVTRLCEGCLVVRSGHGPQAEVAQGVGPGPLVEL